MVSFTMFPMMVFVVMMPLNNIFFFEVLLKFLFLSLDFLFEFDFFEVLVL